MSPEAESEIGQTCPALPMRCAETDLPEASKAGLLGVGPLPLPRGQGRRWYGWLFSCCLHCCLLAGALIFAGYARKEEEQIYRIALVASGVAKTDGTRPGKEGPAPQNASAPQSGQAASSPSAEENPGDKSRVAALAETGAQKRQARNALSKTQKTTDRPRGGTAPSTLRAMPRPQSGFTAQTLASPAASRANASGSNDGTAAAPGSTPSGNTAGQNGSGIYAPGQLDQLPRVLRAVKPAYPQEAKQRKIQGRVLVRLIVNTAGVPTDCTIHAAEPSGYFEETALAAARKTLFTPGKKSGRAVRSLVLLPFDFRLR